MAFFRTTYEFVPGDILVEIYKKGKYVVGSKPPNGYFLDVLVNGRVYTTSSWITELHANTCMIKVGRWDGEREIDDEEA